MNEVFYLLFNEVCDNTYIEPSFLTLRHDNKMWAKFLHTSFYWLDLIVFFCAFSNETFFQFHTNPNKCVLVPKFDEFYSTFHRARQREDQPIVDMSTSCLFSIEINFITFVKNLFIFLLFPHRRTLSDSPLSCPIWQSHKVVNFFLASCALSREEGDCAVNKNVVKLMKVYFYQFWFARFYEKVVSTQNFFSEKSGLILFWSVRDLLRTRGKSFNEAGQAFEQLSFTFVDRRRVAQIRRFCRRYFSLSSHYAVPMWWPASLICEWKWFDTRLTLAAPRRLYWSLDRCRRG